MGKPINAAESSKRAREICLVSKVIPVLTIEKLEDALPVATALIEGGLPVLEVTLRTSNSLNAIKKLSKVDKAIVGAGTLMNRADVENAVEAGAKFGVSPGVTEEILTSCKELGLPLIGGVATVSEAMNMLVKGYNFLKFFPAEILGGVKALGAIGAPLPQVSFCPTGGITFENAAKYLALSNVICVGGSWMATRALIEQKAWSQINEKACLTRQLF